MEKIKLGFLIIELLHDYMPVALQKENIFSTFIDQLTKECLARLFHEMNFGKNFSDVLR